MCWVPTYVKEVDIDRQGEDGLDVWFTLADADSNETCADGSVTLTISEVITEEPTYAMPLYSETRTVSVADFAKWNFTNKLTGAGSDKLLWDSGRILVSKFSRTPFPTDIGERGQVEVEFKTADGQVMRGKSDGLFNFDQ